MNKYKDNKKINTPIIYSAENPLRSPLKLIKELFSNIHSARELTWSLTVRDITAKYRQTILGYFWAIFPPILTSFLFVFLQKSAVININANKDVPYPVFIFSGTILWLLFTDSLNAPLRILQGNKSMLGKINFPREALILSAFLQVMFDFLIRFLILMVVVVYYQYNFHSAMLLYPFLAILICLLGIIIGVFLIPIGMLYSDVISAIPIITQLWFFITPIIYDVSLGTSTSLLFKLNPVTYIFVAVRNIFLYGNILPYLSIIISYIIVLFILLFLAWVIYKVTLPLLIERF